MSGDDILRKFWELEEKPTSDVMSPEECLVIQHFKAHHKRTDNGRFVVPLPKKPNTKPLGESRSQAIHRFCSLERALHAKDLFGDFEAAVEEYFKMGHAELFPTVDLEKPAQEVLYLPMHIVRKESSTTKVRAVFDASASSSTGVSLNDLLMVGPTSSKNPSKHGFKCYRRARRTELLASEHNCSKYFYTKKKVHSTREPKVWVS